MIIDEEIREYLNGVLERHPKVDLWHIWTTRDMDRDILRDISLLSGMNKEDLREWVEGYESDTDRIITELKK